MVQCFVAHTHCFEVWLQEEAPKRRPKVTLQARSSCYSSRNSRGSVLGVSSTRKPRTWEWLRESGLHGTGRLFDCKRKQKERGTVIEEYEAEVE